MVCWAAWTSIAPNHLSSTAHFDPHTVFNTRLNLNWIFGLVAWDFRIPTSFGFYIDDN
jgi:hypothetical protein